MLSDASAGSADTEATIALSTPQGTLRAASTATQSDPVEIALGETLTHVPVNWPVTIRTNPHLMMVGLPGMGKTTALINIAKQLTAAGIAPVIFSYHDDIDDKIAEAIGPIRKSISMVSASIRCASMRRRQWPISMLPEPCATSSRRFFLTWVKSSSRSCAERSSRAMTIWDGMIGPASGRSRRGSAAFSIYSKRAPNPIRNLLARLQELADYGFFDGEKEDAGILADRGQPWCAFT